MVSQIQDCFGKLFADKGHISATLTQDLLENHMLQLVTKRRKNMKNK
jgi:hypothetical protein